MNTRFLDACHRQAVDTTPIWLMRQAGRYMAEYRRLRERYSILEIIKTPELACEVTLQPIQAFDLDAAIIFADILPPLAGMGLQLEFIKGEGPLIHNPVRTVADIDRLRHTNPHQDLAFTLEAIRLARSELKIPLIGFSGAPFTLATYAIEGGSSRHHDLTKRLMMAEPAAWHQLMEKLSQLVGEYLLAQIQAGVHAVQLFDSWAGVLSPADYRAHVLPYTQRAIDIARQGGVPVLYFGTQTNGLLEAIATLGTDVISVDWAIDLDMAWRRIGYQTAIQGNLDPIALFAPWPQLQARAQHILAQAAGRLGHIFNLGHGVLPQTPIDNIKRLVNFVHEYRYDPTQV